MKVLITGGAGYMGSSLTQILLSKGYDVCVFDILMFGGDQLLGALPHPRFKFIRGDVRDEVALRDAMSGCQAVVHLAAIVGDPACARDPEQATEVNLEASTQAFTIAEELEVDRFVFASTCSNYGRMLDPDNYVSEDSDLIPVSHYAETKVGVEKFLLDIRSGGRLIPTLLRFATLFGISPRMRFDLTVNHFTMELYTTGALEVHGAQFWRPYVHVRDASRAISQVLSAPSDRIAGEVFNVGDTGQNYRKGEIANLASKYVGDGVDVTYVEKEEDPRDYRVRFDKIRDSLDFKITRTVEDGVREIVDALRNGIISDLANPKYRN